MSEGKTKTAAGWQIGLAYAVVCTSMFFALIAFYDWTHWDQIKARNACEAIPEQIYVWGDYGRPSGCVKEIHNDPG